MKIVVQRSLYSEVLVDNEIVGSISSGMVLLVCFEKNDEEHVISKAAEKILALRIFEDPENGKMNLNLDQVGGQILAISQFTLSWNGTKGNRPGFDASMKPEQANQFFQKFCQLLSDKVSVQTGRFGASMQVKIQNDGPVTFSLSF